MIKLIVRYSIFIFLLASCGVKPRLSPLQRYKEAIELYEKKEYANAASIFREIMIPLIGKNEEIDVRFYLGMCYYHREQYLRAVDAFKEFFDLFPNAVKAEESLYLAGECLYKESPYSNLDQSITYEALDTLDLYITAFSSGRYIDRVVKYTTELKQKLAKKDFDNIYVFYNLGYYDATIRSCDNFLEDHSNSELCSEILYLKIHSLYKLYEMNKVNTHALELHLNLLKSCAEFLILHTDNKHREEVKNIQILFTHSFNTNPIITKS